MARRVPVPVYADSVADEMAYVLDHAGAVFACVQDQEQVDKVLSVTERLPNLRHMLYDEPRGLRDYDHAKLHDIGDVIEAGRAALKDAAVSAAHDARWSRGKRRPRHHPLHLRHHRAAQGGDADALQRHHRR
jgi:long-chain acyl-CoA synthetase